MEIKSTSNECLSLKLEDFADFSAGNNTRSRTESSRSSAHEWAKKSPSRSLSLGNLRDFNPMCTPSDSEDSMIEENGICPVPVNSLLRDELSTRSLFLQTDFQSSLALEVEPLREQITDNCEEL